jgi:hypothetical protein
MKRRITVAAITALTMIAFMSAVFAGSPATPTQGAKQIAGVGSYAAPGACTDPEGDGADYVLTLTGSL